MDKYNVCVRVDEYEKRIQQLLEANNRYVEQNRKLKGCLSRARNKFDFYAEEHARKSNDYRDVGLKDEADKSYGKMNANLDMSIDITNTLQECRPV